MRRREFIAGLGGAAAVGWPLAALGQQQGERVRKIGALLALAENDPVQQSWIKELQEGLEKLGWQIGRNLRIEYRWTAGNVDRMRVAAAELVGLAPDLLLAGNVPTTAALQRETPSIPTVFVQVAEPVTLGFVASFAHPGGNITGFMAVDSPMAGKRLEWLKSMAPAVRRVAVMFNPVTSGRYMAAELQVAEKAAASLGIEITTAHVQGAADIENTFALLASRPDNGLLVGPDITTTVHRELIAKLAALHRLPAFHPYRYYVTVGGLASYGNDIAEHYRLAAGYIDRILKGEKPSDLPVQAPNKFEFVINLKAAKALGLEIPPGLLALADEVIE
jgi:putative ABC transport system substrate-binding protein